MGETRVFQVYDPATGDTFGVSPTRYGARKLAKEFRCRVRRIWTKTIITNEPHRFANCPKR